MKYFAWRKSLEFEMEKSNPFGSFVFRSRSQKSYQIVPVDAHFPSDPDVRDRSVVHQPARLVPMYAQHFRDFSHRVCDLCFQVDGHILS
jgi:hypothetical protein